ncbi:DUF5309 domain-containing protein [Stenotrophomonas lactitubi]|uniref:DUF5309 domain-containing protein n=1 Tax=Stenotrophomonas lactitubi TaxID=2045214 RepID=UPI002249483F|nr:DUF5309 domain-containing protein [Stenotrophomonas lactitubi]MCX2894338.1 DUF5309 domain-containing protein [Stenotrophomonas lactitubi]
MAVLANTFTTYAAIGQREDLSDIIDMISPTDTPFLSSLKKSKASARFFEWQTDALDAAANNAQIEGDEATFNAVTPTTRWGNYTQISRKTFIISDTEEVVDKAGRKSEIAHQTRKALAALKRDQEVALVQNGTFNAGAVGTARQTRGLAGWITQGSVGAGAGVFPVPSTNTAAVAGTARPFTEALVKSAMQAAYTAGGAPTMLLVRPADKVIASSFAGNATRYEDADSGKLHAAFDVYVTDFGALKIVPDRFIDAAAYLIDPEHVSLKTLRPVSRQELAKTGDATKTLIVAEYGLEMGNKDAHAQIRDLT